MTLLEILLHELESWPEGSESAFQALTTSELYFYSPYYSELKTMHLNQLATDRGPSNAVTRREWEVAKIKSLPFFKDVSAILGEERAVEELLAVGEINYEVDELIRAFAFVATPQGYDFWNEIAAPRGADKLKVALSTITTAMKDGHYIRLHPDGSGYVCDRDDERVHYFASTDDLVDEYLSPSPTPEFEHWHLLHDQFKWVAKNSDGGWWAYVDKPDLRYDQWHIEEGRCCSLDILKFDTPCHWKRSLIERPAL